MYTLQSGQIENALRMGGSDDVSAKQMVQGIANCQQLLEHRGNVDLTKPVVNYFPTILPARNSVSYPFTQKDVFIDVPPFKMKEWEPIPYIPMPPWEQTPYPQWPEFGWQGLDRTQTLNVPGGATLGTVVTKTIAAGEAKAGTLDVSGNARVGSLGVAGDVDVGGRVRVGGDLTVNGNTILNGPVNMAGPVTVSGTRLAPLTLQAVTRVYWAGGSLKADIRTFRLFGAAQGLETKTVIEGTECP